MPEMTETSDRTGSAFWVTGARRGEIRPEALAPPEPDEVLVRASFSAISRGTEMLVWRGGVPESQRTRMRAPFQAGVFPWPVKYGYCAVGCVEEGPPTLIGRSVFCLHPHQDRFVVPADAVTVLPDDLPPARAILAANMETALNAVWDGGPKPGDHVSVIGAGTVGCLVAWLIGQIPGTRVELIDREPGKQAIAEALGVEFRVPDRASNDRDLVFHATGNPDGLASALAVAGDDTAIVELSWFGDQPVTLPLGDDFHDRRLRIISSQVGRLPVACRARWSHARRMAAALDLLRDAVLDGLVTGEDAFLDLPDVLRRIENDAMVLCHRITY